MSNQNIFNARRLGLRRAKIFMRKVLEACDIYKVVQEERDKIRAFMGISNRAELLLSSDLHARVKAGRLLEKAMIKHLESRPQDSRRYFFGTFIDDSANTSDRCPVISIKALRDKAYRALKSVGLHAVASIEVHPLMNHPGGGEGRTLLWHVHFIAWCDEEIDLVKTIVKLELTGAWTCKLGAAPIDIVDIDNEELAFVAHYMTKAPHSAKNRKEKPDKPGAYQLFDTIKGYRPELALRVLEGLSQIELLDTIFGVGDGKVIRQSLRKGLTEWHRKRKAPVVISADHDTWMFWLTLRQTKGSKRFLPFRIVGTSPVRATKPRKPRATTPARRKSTQPSKAQKRAFYKRVQRQRGKQR